MFTALQTSDIEALLRSRRTQERIRAVPLMLRARGATRRALLLRALHDRAPYVAALAAKALGHEQVWNDADDSGGANVENAGAMTEEGANVVAAMVARFLHLAEDGLGRDPGCHVRAHLAFAFGRLEHRPAIEALRAGIRTVQIEAVGGVPFDTGAHLRANCALALAQMRAPDALRDIALLLFDNGTPGTSDLKYNAVEPRRAAAQALGRLRDHNALVPLALRLTHPAGESPDVLQECMQSVVALHDPRALELLQPYLENEDEHLAAFAALMIAQTRAPQAPTLLRRVIERLEGDALNAVVLALTTLRTPEAETVLRDLTEHARPEVRAAARAVAPAALIENENDKPGAQTKRKNRR